MGRNKGGKEWGGGLSKKDAAKLTSATKGQVKKAWHEARTDAGVRKKKK